MLVIPTDAELGAISYGTVRELSIRLKELTFYIIQRPFPPQHKRPSAIHSTRAAPSVRTAWCARADGRR
jgi:hypothetical protein